MVAEWFKDHKATPVSDWRTPHPNIIDWRRPDTSNYAMRFIISGGHVIVVGDVGDAIYGFGSVLTFEFLAGTDWHYFWGKCVASETGRRYEQKVDGISRPVINIRAIAHHTGLQMAIRQILTKS
jgi:hypothetical protein